MIEIEINGKIIQAEPGSMIIEVADRAGIPIPRFCYHKKLSIAANCRMCLVEVEKVPKPLPACATPITAGMKVFTTSARAKEAQKSVMEFLLINHPLDCPICDQGGECELQDVSLQYGAGISRFTSGKRSVKDDNLGSLIATEMTRCIHCTRCVRFGTEVAGIRELGATGRGEKMQISTYIAHSLTSEFSGNIIDLCPVGALTSKPFRFTARAWEMRQTATIAPHDCVGSNIYLHSLRQEVMRAVPRENETINETWISDRDRFGYLGVKSPDRLHKPLMKIANEWLEVDWATAITFTAERLAHINKHSGPEQIAAIVSPSSTLEELYLVQKLMRELGSNNIDHRIHQTDFADQNSLPLYLGLNGASLEEIEKQEQIVLIGSNVSREQPIVAHRIRKATLKGAKVIDLNMLDCAATFSQQEKLIVAPHQFVRILAGIAKKINEKTTKEFPAEIKNLLKNINTTAEEERLAQSLLGNKKTVFLLGALAQNHPEAATIRFLSAFIAKQIDAKLGYLTDGSNSAGAYLVGAIPHRGIGGIAITTPGLTAYEMIKERLKAFIFLQLEPELDLADSALARATLQEAEFIVGLSSFASNDLLHHANVILPIATFAETAGTYVNVEGRWQNFPATVKPVSEVRPAWQVLKVLAKEMKMAGFEYSSTEEISSEIKKILDQSPSLSITNFYPKEIKEQKIPVVRITEWPIYAVDSILRRAPALQEAASNDAVGVVVNEQLASSLKLNSGMTVKVTQEKNSVILPLIISNRIPDGCALIHAGREETAGLGPIFGAIEIHAG